MEFLFSIPAIDERGRVVKIYFIFLNEKTKKGKRSQREKSNSRKRTRYFL